MVLNKIAHDKSMKSKLKRNQLKSSTEHKKFVYNNQQCFAFQIQMLSVDNKNSVELVDSLKCS